MTILIIAWIVFGVFVYGASKGIFKDYYRVASRRFIGEERYIFLDEVLSLFLGALSLPGIIGVLFLYFKYSRRLFPGFCFKMPEELKA